MTGLSDPVSRTVFHRIRVTSPDRAAAAEAARHRCLALSLARAFGMAIHPQGTQCLHNWDGMALNGATEAYVILHEVAHFALAPHERRGLIDFGLGPGPDTIDHDAAESATVLPLLAREEDEAAASLLGIVWEVELGQSALASFLDQNWLEGLDRSAASHFTTVLGALRRRRLLTLRSPGRFDKAWAALGRQVDRARCAGCGCRPDLAIEYENVRAAVRRARFERRASTRARARLVDSLFPQGDSPGLPSRSPS